MLASRSQSANPLWLFASTPQPGAYFVPAIQLRAPDHQKRCHRREGALVHSRWRVLFAGLILAVLGAGSAAAQSVDFNLFVTINGNTFKEDNGSQIGLNTQVGSQASASVTATYIGTTQATISAQPQSWVVGSMQFTVTVPKS